jgi:hypothetical protein
MKIINNSHYELENTPENVLDCLKNISYDLEFQEPTNSVVIRYNGHYLTININKIEEIVISKTPTIRCKGVTIHIFSTFILTQIL